MGRNRWPLTRVSVGVCSTVIASPIIGVWPYRSEREVKRQLRAYREPPERVVRDVPRRFRCRLRFAGSWRYSCGCSDIRSGCRRSSNWPVVAGPLKSSRRHWGSRPMRCRSICVSCIARGCCGGGRRATGHGTDSTTPRQPGRSSCWRAAQKSAGDLDNRQATADHRRRPARLADDVAEHKHKLADHDHDAVVAAWARAACSLLLSFTSSGLSLRSRRSVSSCRSPVWAVCSVRLSLCVCGCVGAVSIAGRSWPPGRCWAP